MGYEPCPAAKLALHRPSYGTVGEVCGVMRRGFNGCVDVAQLEPRCPAA